MAGMPAGAQMLSSSPYLDAGMWQYDTRHCSPLLRFRALAEQPLRFVSAAHPRHARFKLMLPEAPPARGQEAAGGAAAAGGRVPKTLAALHFHPVQPFVMCVMQTLGQPPQLCMFHRF